MEKILAPCSQPAESTQMSQEKFLQHVREEPDRAAARMARYLMSTRSGKAESCLDLWDFGCCVGCTGHRGIRGYDYHHGESADSFRTHMQKLKGHARASGAEVLLDKRPFSGGGMRTKLETIHNRGSLPWSRSPTVPGTAQAGRASGRPGRVPPSSWRWEAGLRLCRLEPVPLGMVSPPNMEPLPVVSQKLWQLLRLTQLLVLHLNNLAKEAGLPTPLVGNVLQVNKD